MEGQTLSHYKVLEKLGGGGMGVVYKALDTKLDRHVALKFLPPELTRDDEARTRFMQEAKAASALDHPNICTIYEIDETSDGQMFIAMGFYEGETLKERIAKGPLPVDDALDIAIQMAQGLSKAHAAGIIHRDIKPANVIITTDGLAKIVDFGIAKLLGVTGPTQTGTTLGTVSYMSPEQIAGDDVDQQSDVWSLGAVLYEMLTGQAAFRGEHQWTVMNAITNRAPASPRSLRSDITAPGEQAVMKALEKSRDERYASAQEFLSAIRAQVAEHTGAVSSAAPTSSLQAVLTPTVVVALLFTATVIGFGVFRLITEDDAAQLAREELLPEIRQLAEADSFVAAFDLAEQAEQAIPGDPQLAELWPLISSQLSITTVPSDAAIHIHQYSDAESPPILIGQSPIREARFPQGFFRLRIQREGYEPRESMFSLFAQRGPSSYEYDLAEEGSVPDRMVPVPGGPATLFFMGLTFNEGSLSSDFFLDQFEVTNSEFKKFVDAGGYEQRDYWVHEFARDGEVLSWEEAMSEFSDETGQPGPATWRVGTFPEDQSDYPVTGVSWYEAAAYATFAGKSLPTIYHWHQAATLGQAAAVISQSNFSQVGPARVGSYAGVGQFGNYDMGGNAKEWVLNASGEERYLLGGGWSDPAYLFYQPEVRSPFDRSPANGFRTATYALDGDTDPITSNIPLPTRDYDEETPVSDEVFEAYRAQFLYDELELNAMVELVDDSSQYWRKEKITFDAVYGNERVPAFLFLPKSGTPPYQTVVFVPGASVRQRPSSDDLGPLATMIEFLPLSGRAVLYPIYKGTYERSDGTPVSGSGGRAVQQLFTMMTQDLMRSIDYLETRDDIDSEKLAYLGYSMGGFLGAIAPAVEPRLKASVVALAGLPMGTYLPAIDPINFVTRVTIPTLMLNGQYDFVYPPEASQVPMYELLGTPDEHKRRVLFEDVGHDLFPVRQNSLIRETLAWLDNYLGAVN